MKKTFFIFLSLFLTSCSQFSIKKNYNEFRNIEQCSMLNNFIEVKYRKKINNLFFNFTSERKNNIKTYDLTIENFTNLNFKDDSNLILNLIFDKNFTQEIKLIAYKAENNANKNLKALSGNFIKGIYYPGSIYSEIDHHSYANFHLTPEQLKDLTKAINVKFKLESLTGETIEGAFTLENLKNLEEFYKICVK